MPAAEPDDALEERVRDVLELVLGPLAPGTARGASHVDLELDSFLLVDVCAALEMAFGVRLAPRELAPGDYATVAALAATLRPRLAPATGAAGAAS